MILSWIVEMFEPLRNLNRFHDAWLSKRGYFVRIMLRDSALALSSYDIVVCQTDAISAGTNKSLETIEDIGVKKQYSCFEQKELTHAYKKRKSKITCLNSQPSSYEGSHKLKTLQQAKRGPLR